MVDTMAARKKIDLTELSVDELQSLQEKLNSHLENLKQIMRVREEVIKKVLKNSDVKAICKHYNFDINYLFNPPSDQDVAASGGKTKKRASSRRMASVEVLKPKKKRVVLPKYRLPTGETWSGRGLMPKIFTRYMERGGKLEDVAIR